MVSRREKWISSLLGELRLKRAYYHCSACGQGWFPWDQEVGLGASHLTPAASEVTCLAGVQASFAQASETTLRKLCGLRISESTVERTTESAGERLRARPSPSCRESLNRGSGSVTLWAARVLT